MTGSKRLALWRVSEKNAETLEATQIWHKDLANPVEYMDFSPDYTQVVTISAFDRLAKVWQRTSFDADNVDFDFTYLPHPSAVQRAKWRRAGGSDGQCALYTQDKKGTLYLWAPNGESRGMALWATIEVPPEASGFLLDASLVAKASQKRKHTANGSTRGSASGSVSPQDSGPSPDTPDVYCIIHGNKALSVHVIDNVGRGARLIKVRCIAERVPLHFKGAGTLPAVTRSIYHHAFIEEEDRESSLVSVLVHDLGEGGVLYHYKLAFDDIMRENSWDVREMFLQSILTGHNKSIRRITRATDGSTLFTQSRFTENTIWQPKKVGSGITLQRVSSIVPASPVAGSVIVSSRRWLVTLLEDRTIVLWDYSHHPEAVMVAEGAKPEGLDDDCRLMSFFMVPESDQDALHFVAVFDRKHMVLWELDTRTTRFVRQQTTQLAIDDELWMVTAVDPVGFESTVTDTDYDEFRRDVVMTVAVDGTVRSWTAIRQNSDENHDGDKMFEWMQTSTVTTGVREARKVQVSSTRKVALANKDGTQLSIWDARSNRVEFEKEFDEDPIQDLDWTTSPGGQNVLGVGFERNVVLYAQQRFDYTNDTPAWAPFRRVNISQFTSHLIGDSNWLEHGIFVLGAGNQLFVQDEGVDVNDETTRQLLGSRNTAAMIDNSYSIFDVCAILNGPLPLYHPQLLIQLVYADRMEHVKQIVCLLLHKLTFAPVLEPALIADIDSQLGVTPGAFLAGLIQAPGDRPFSKAVCDDLVEKLQAVSLPYLTRHQQITLASVVECLADLVGLAQSLDANAVRYLLGYRLYRIHKGIQSTMNTRDFTWATHSESKTVLLDIVNQDTAPLLWRHARDVGLAYWLDAESLRATFEQLGRNHFAADGKRDPVACSLYYLALKKKPVVVGLWRTATGHKEQTKTLKVLQNDFTQQRWKSAALKNAFALLGKHRFEYAAAFFLLGDAPWDAAAVLARRLNDIPLAVAVARVYGGDDSLVFRRVLEEIVFPYATERSDPWLASWSLWMIRDRQNALSSLAFDDTHAQSFLVDDPVLIMLYRYIRIVKHYATSSANVDEYRLVLRTAEIYARMGCDLLALDLLRTWKFAADRAPPNGTTSTATPAPAPDAADKSLPQPPSTPSVLDEKPKPAQTANLKPAAAVAFQEPDLSAFDFGF